MIIADNMKTILKVIIPALIAFSHNAYSQGWRAEIDLDLNHNLYGYERIDNVTLTFSGVTVTGSSPRSTLNLVITGNDPMSGEINLSITGTASEPYDPQDTPTKAISLTLSGNYSKVCERGFLSNQDPTNMEQVSVWITIYPRLQISSFVQECDRLTLTSNTCTPSFKWEVSDNISGNFKIVEGQTGSSMVITREELVAMGFSSPYGRKYFRVTGLHMTTSQLQPVDIYYPGPSATIFPTNPHCHNGSDGTVTINIASSYPPGIDDFVATLFRRGPPDTPLEQESLVNTFELTFSELPAGNYRVVIENNSAIGTYGSCWTEHLFELQNPQPVTINSAELSDHHGYNITCHDNMDGTITVRAAGGTGNYASYEWEPSVSTTHVAENLAEGMYKVKVKDSNGCESTQYSYEMRAPEPLLLSLVSTGGKNGFDVTCHDMADGEITPSVSGGVPDYTFVWADGNVSASRTDLAPGNYSAVVTDANGCMSSASTTLIAPPPIDFFIAELQSVTCAGDHSGVLQIQSITNTFGTVSFLWSSGETQQQITDKQAGSYSATVQDDQGCTAEKVYTLTDPPAYSVDVAATSDYNGMPIRCNGDNSGKLTAAVYDEKGQPATADNFLWYRDAKELVSGPSVATVSDLVAATYTVEITYRSFCKATDMFILVEPPPVQPAISVISDYHGSAISCAGGHDGVITASATGGTGSNYVYKWNTEVEGHQLGGIGAGTYSVTVLDINGCSGTSEKELSGPEPLRAGISVLSNYNGQAISCSGAADARIKAVAVGGTLPYSYTWNSGSTAMEIADLPSGLYHVTVRDVNGCTTQSDTPILDPAPVMAKIISRSDYHGFGVSCRAAADGFLLVEGTGGTGTYSFVWQGSMNTRPLHSNLKAGHYRVDITDQNGCRASTEEIVTEPEVLTLEVVSSANVSCNSGTDGKIELAAGGGAGFYEYSTSPEAWTTESVLTGLKAGIYDAVVKDVNGCEQVVRHRITEPAKLAIEFHGITPSLCGDPRGEATAFVTGGSGGYQYEWRDARQTILGNEAHISSLPAGIFMLHVVDSNACTAAQSLGITSTDGPKVAIDKTVATACSYSADGAASITVAGQHPPFTIQWSDGQAGVEAVGLLKGDYFVEVMDDEKCSTVETVQIAGPDSLVVEVLQIAEPTCNGQCDGQIAVDATGGTSPYLYRWNDSSAGSSIDSLCSGDYTVKVTDQHACVATSVVRLSEPEPIAVNLVSARSPVCPERCDGTLEVLASGGVGSLQYLWSSGATSSTISDLCAGEYRLTVTDSNHCEVAAHYTLEQPQKRSVDLGGSIMLCEGQTHTLDPGPVWHSTLWDSDVGFQSKETRVVISKPGTYWLEAVDMAGCTVRDTFLLETSTELLKANFLLASEAFVGDTVVIIDISWPLPEETSWTFPEEMQKLYDMRDIVYGQFGKAGSYDITLTVGLGECRDRITKSVIINGDSLEDATGRLGYHTLVKEFSLYPNPNDGSFDVMIGLMEEKPIELTVWNILTSRKVAHIRDSGNSTYLKHVDLRPLSPGSYSLRFDFDQGFRYIRFIVR